MASTFRRRPAKNSSASSNSPSLSVAKLKGTKPWTGGISLTSTGLRDLDAILLSSVTSASNSSGGGGGGQPLGTAILVEEDRWTRLGLVLVKYWCAEALSQQQHLLIPVSDDDSEDTGDDRKTFEAPCPSSENTVSDVSANTGRSARAQVMDLLSALPKNLHRQHWERKQREKNGDVEETTATIPPVLETLDEEEEDVTAAEAEAEAGLKIAWQYRKSVQQERLGQKDSTSRSKIGTATGKDVFCHSYDLGSTENSPWLDTAHVVSISEGSDCEKDSDVRIRGLRYFRRIRKQMEDLLTTLSGCDSSTVLGTLTTPVRLLFYHTDIALLTVALPLLLSHIRTQELPVVVLVAVQPWIAMANGIERSLRDSLLLLRRNCDVALETEGFAGRRVYPPPPEFRHLQGLLKLNKISCTAATANGVGGGHFADWTVTKRPTATLYGLKRDRRKLHIQLLHIPPEDYAEGGGSVGGGGVRSGAGRKTLSSQSSGGCGSGGENSILDF